MKAVAFVCLLSLSLCLSKPAGQPEAPSTHAATSPNTDKASPTEHKEAPTTSTIKTIINIVTTSTEKPHEKASKTAEQATPNETKPSETTPETKPDTTEKKENASKPVDPKTNDTKSTTEKPTEAPKPTEEVKTTEKAKEAATTTSKPVTDKPTEAPKDTTEKPMVTARGFDGASFIGGIILTLGLLAIGFMGFKYYKNQTERNYHTL